MQISVGAQASHDSIVPVEPELLPSPPVVPAVVVPDPVDEVGLSVVVALDPVDEVGLSVADVEAPTLVVALFPEQAPTHTISRAERDVTDRREKPRDRWRARIA